MPEEQKRPEPNYSYTAQLLSRLTDEATKRLERLPPSAFKAFIAYCERRQLDIALDVVKEDDPLTSAKLRGQNDILLDIAGDMFGYLAKTTTAKETENG